MSEEAKKFIEVTDLVDHTDYENSDCGEGYILNGDHLADLLEAYHQERTKQELFEYMDDASKRKLGDPLTPTQQIEKDEILRKANTGNYSPIVEVTSEPPKESGTGAAAHGINVEDVCADWYLYGTPRGELGCNMDQGRGPISKESLQASLDEWATARGLLPKETGIAQLWSDVLDRHPDERPRRKMTAVFYLDEKAMQSAIKADSIYVDGRYYTVPKDTLQQLIDEDIEGSIELTLTERHDN